jgi:DNA mismatch repair protein MutS
MSSIMRSRLGDERPPAASRQIGALAPSPTATLILGEAVSSASRGAFESLYCADMPRSAQLTPMLRHYLEVKGQHPDAVLLYRMGDFYEAFFEDAVEAAPILEVALTARNKGKENEAPMCGVPHHALEVYLGKLIRAGRRVAICDQVEDPAEAKGLVRREVTRVVTPGTVTEPQLLEGSDDNLLAGVTWEKEGEGEAGAAAFLDISTGLFFVRRWRGIEEGIQDLALQRPREVLAGNLPEELEEWITQRGICRTAAGEDLWVDSKRAAEALERHFGTATLRGFGLDAREAAVQAAALTLRYAQETQQSELPHVRGLSLRQPDETLILDSETLGNLEVFRGARAGGRQGTLLSVLDKTVTAAGGRLLKDWLRRPLRDPGAIGSRLDAVEELFVEAQRRERVREGLSACSDLGRLLSRAVLGSLTPREAGALRDTLEAAPAILVEIESARSVELESIAAVDPVADLCGEMQRVLEAQPPASLARGGVIATGVDEELDRCRSLDRDSKRHVLELERRERERTGIGSLKIRFNKVFGYYLEVTRSKSDLVPDEYVRKQTLVNAERFITPELKELEEQILSAEARLQELEREHFELLRQRIVATGERLEGLAAALSRLDVLAGFAEVAARNRYIRPRIGDQGAPIEIRDGRHPVVERLAADSFVPNDVDLGGDNGDIVVLTGPNMGGKSTYLRQVALIVLMAQSGSFVPAAEASLGTVDRIFTRVGASDDLTRGESTFMVEMVETAKILHQATGDSLVVLDEVGRGTATFDGLSLAWAIVESLHRDPCPKTLFATHYHELTELAAILPKVVNRTLSVKEWEDKIVFLRRVIPGSADKSYGLHVARLAGIPSEVIERAGQILANLEAQEYDLRGKPRIAKGGPEVDAPGADQLTLFAPPEQVVAAILQELDVEQLSPLAALNLLNALKKRLGT